MKALPESFVGRPYTWPRMSGLNYKGNDKPCPSPSDSSHRLFSRKVCKPHPEPSVHVDVVWESVLGRREAGNGAGSHPVTLK